MKNGEKDIDPDDYFSETRMSFGDHLEDLRTHLSRAVKGFFIAVLLSFFVGWWVLEFITAPVEEQLRAFYDRRVERVKERLAAGDAKLQEINRPQATKHQFKTEELADLFKVKINPKSGVLSENGEWATLTVRIRPFEEVWVLHQAQQIVGRRPALSTLSVQEAFVVYFQVCIITGFVLASPWVFYQIWSFVAAGMYPHEKRLVNVYLPFSIGLFLGGVGVCQFLVMPRAVEALLWFNEWLGLEPELRLNEWLGFAIWMPVIFGLSFQTPLVMMFLDRIGVFDVESYRAKRRMAWFGMAVFAAVITPSTDALSMLFLWVPMSLLYELGIWLCLVTNKRSPLDIDVPDPEEMVEV